MVAAMASTRVATLLNSFACIGEINTMQRYEGSGRDTTLNFQGALASMSIGQATSSLPEIICSFSYIMGQQGKCNEK